MNVESVCHYSLRTRGRCQSPVLDVKKTFEGQILSSRAHQSTWGAREREEEERETDRIQQHTYARTRDIRHMRSTEGQVPLPARSNRIRRPPSGGT